MHHCVKAKKRISRIHFIRKETEQKYYLTLLKVEKIEIAVETRTGNKSFRATFFHCSLKESLANSKQY